MKKQRIAACIALACVCANAATWTGAAADGDWANSANWSEGVAPENDGVAVFETAATLAPPASFTGTIAVSNAVVTVNVAEASAFSSAVHSSGKLVKAGAGELTLRAASGFHTGEIAIDAGTVRFEGNGEYGAPGLWGKLTVAPGAAAVVAESPATTRHGAPVIAVGRNNVSINEAGFNALTDTFDKFCATWGSIAAENANERIILVPDESPALFELALWVPPTYLWGNFFNAYARAVFVFPKAENLLIQHRADDLSVAYVDGVKRFVNNNATGVANFSLTSGWHTVDAAFADNSGGENLNMILMADGLGEVSRFTSDVLWKGVCFNGLSLPAGASLTVGDGQAVAFALGNETDVKGTVAGGADAVVAIASGEFNASAAAFADFAGSIEVMRLASADITEIPADPAFRLSGRGSVAASMSPLLGSGFAGVVDVPAGATCVDEFGDDVSFTGAGTLVTPSLKGLEKFTGTVKLVGAGDAGDLDDAATAAQALTLADGASLTIGVDALSKVADTTVADGLREGDWTFNGISNSNGSGEFTGNIAYMSNDVIVVTDDGGSQRNSAIYTNRVFTVADDCEFSFVYRNEMLKRFSYESRAEGASFFFTAQPNGYGSNKLMAWPSDAYGFTLYQYRSASTGMTWLEGGNYLNAPNYTEAQMGFDMRNPMNITMRLRKGVLYVTLEQNGKTFTASRNMANGFRATDKMYFGVSGGTGYWGLPSGGTADVYCYQTISNFTARLRGYGHHDVEDGYLPITPETWRIKDSGVALTNGNELAFAYWAPANASFNGFAVCKKKVSTRRPFSITFNERLETAVGGWAEGISIIFTPDGDQVSNSGRTFYCGLSKSVSFVHYFWENRYCWTHNNSAYSADKSDSNPGGIPKTSGTNNIRIDYDGRGTFTATVTRGNNEWKSVRTYADVPEWGEEMSFGFMGGTSTWGAYLPTFISDVDLFFSHNMPVDVPAVNVEAGATAALSVGNLEKTADEASVRMKSVTLGAGATLDVGAELAYDARVAFDEVTAAGAATLAAGGNAVVELADVRAEGPLTVTGAWAGDVVFHVDATRIGSGIVLANLDPALYAGEGEPVFEVVDQNGNSLKGGYVLTYKNGVLRLAPGGMILIVR